MSLLFSIRVAAYHLFGKELFIRLTVHVLLINFYVCPSFPFGFEGGMSDLIVLILDHCLSDTFRLSLF